MPQPSTAKIEQAIDALIRAVLANDPSAGLPPPEHTILPADIDAAMIVDADLDLIIADPIGSACRSELAALGSMLFETIGSTDDIGDVADRIVAMDGSHQDRRRAVLEASWVDIGAEGDAGLE